GTPSAAAAGLGPWLTFAPAVTLTGPAALSGSGEGGTVLTGALDLNGFTPTLSSGRGLTLAGRVTGAGGLRIVGGVTLSGDNDFTGPTALEYGNVEITSDHGLGATGPGNGTTGQGSVVLTGSLTVAEGVALI